MLGGFPREAALKDRKLFEDFPFLIPQHLPSGIKNSSDTLVTFRRIPSLSFEEIEAILDFFRNLLGGEHLNPGCCQLNPCQSCL